MKDDVKMPAIVPRIFYTALFVFGIVLYISWGLLFNVWFDIGIYAVTVLLVGFGVVGMMLYLHKERKELEHND